LTFDLSHIIVEEQRYQHNHQIGVFGACHSDALAF